MLSTTPMKLSSSNGIAVFCFDFDGTIANTMPYLTDLAVGVLCKYYGIDRDQALTRYINTTGLPFSEQVASIFPGNPNNVAAIDEFERFKALKYFDLDPSQGARDTLDHLRALDYRIAISSSTLTGLVTNYLKIHKLPFDIALGYAPHFRKGKDHFDFIASKYSVSLSEICYVGDSLNDYMLAMKSGVDFIAKTGIFSKEDFRKLDSGVNCISRLDELELYV